MRSKQLKETVSLVIGICAVMFVLTCGSLFAWYQITYDEDEHKIAERNKEFAKARAKSFVGE